MEIIYKPKKVIKVKQVHETVIEQVPHYVTSDGVEFVREHSALAHERRLQRLSIHVNNPTAIIGNVEFHYVSSIQDIEDVSDAHFASHHTGKEFPFWLGIEYDDDTYYEVSLEDLQSYAEGIYASFLEIREAVEGWVEHE